METIFELIDEVAYYYELFYDRETWWGRTLIILTLPIHFLLFVLAMALCFPVGGVIGAVRYIFDL